MIGHLHRHHLGHAHHVPRFPQEAQALRPVADDQPQDAELLRVSQAERADVDARPRQDLAGGSHLSGKGTAAYDSMLDAIDAAVKLAQGRERGLFA